MPNIKSSIKRVKVQAKKAQANKAQRSRLNTSLKQARIAVADQDENAEEIVKRVSAEMDKAAGQGHISKQKAARHKSQLAKAMNQQDSEA